MKILFLTHYFPPEVNAPASRTFEHCREWVNAGHEVHVITGVPSHPRGVPFPGYRRTWYRQETMVGIHVHRVWTYLAPNAGVGRRIANYLSFIPTATLRAATLEDFDVIIATSPQFFCAVAGFFASALKRTPWIFELRDLWPESIAAVGAMQPNLGLRLLERIELGLYNSASLVVCLTQSFGHNLQARGISGSKLRYVPNGVDISYWASGDRRSARAALGLKPDEIAVSYIGTVGMAHGIGTLIDCATRLLCDSPSVRFFVIGDGAQLDELRSSAEKKGLTNLRFLGLVPKHDAVDMMAASDISLVLLKKSETFKAVLPSKMFEAMGAAKPVILAVEGEAKRVLERSEAGIAVEPENVTELADAIIALAGDEARRREMGDKGQRFVGEQFDRNRLARAYLQAVESCCLPRQARAVA